MNDISNASHSDVVTFLRCPKQFELRVIRNLQAKRRGDAKLHIGVMSHKLLQTIGIDSTEFDAVLRKFREEAQAQAFSDDELLESYKLIDLSESMVRRYQEFWAEDIEHMKVLHVEEEFVFTWEHEGRTFQLRVTPDRVEQDMRTGTIWIRDYKTVDSIPESKEIPTYQQLTYLAAVQAAYPDHQVGFVLDFLKRKEPVEPRLNLSNTKESKEFGHLFVNNVKTVDTTFELLDHFIRTEAPALLNEPSHIMRLESLKEENQFFQRDIIWFNPTMIENGMIDVTGALLSMESATAFPRVFVTNAGTSCDRCEFKPLCFAELRGEAVDSMLEAFYEDRVAKNPYDREEESEDS